MTPRPIEVLRAAVEAAREIPELLAETGGDPTKIEAFVDRYADAAGMMRAFAEAKEGTAIFALESIRPAPSGIGSWWRYRYAVRFFPRVEIEPDEGAVWRMWAALAKGRCADGRRWLHKCFVERTDAPQVLTAERRQLLRFGDEAVEIVVGVFEIDDAEA